MSTSSNKNISLIKLFSTIVIVLSVDFYFPQGANSLEVEKKTVQAFMIPAIEAYRNENYEEALKWIEQALQLSPDEPSLARLRNEIVLKISDQYHQQGDRQKARSLASKVLTNPHGGLISEAKNRISLLDSRPKNGFHGYISTGIEYNTNVASSVDPGNEQPTNTPGYGSQSGILLGYLGHISDDFYWDIWGEALPVFWKGAADNLDWQQYSTGFSLGVTGDLWDFSVAYQFSSDVFDSHLNRIRNGVETKLTYWAIPSHWQALITAGVFFDDFRFIDEANATFYEIGLHNYVPYFLGEHDEYAGYIYGGYTYLDNNASSIYGYNGHRVNLVFYIPTPFSSLGIQTGGWLERRNYDAPNPVDRRDTLGSFYVEIVKQWALPDRLTIKDRNNSLQTKLGYIYSETQSSSGIFDKKEHVARFTITYYF